jgi:hypothetical protein
VSRETVTRTFLSAAITVATVLVVGVAAYTPAIAVTRHHHVVRRYPPPRVRAYPQQQIACTVLGCRPVPPGCDFYTRTYDIVVCPPGVEPFR